jgi:hypothetical protein
MATTPTYINQRINNLQAQINSIISGGGGGVPTSSDLADVLDNGNSAGTFDIDMNFNDITNTNQIVLSDNVSLTNTLTPSSILIADSTPSTTTFTATSGSVVINNPNLNISTQQNSIQFIVVDNGTGEQANLNLQSLQFLNASAPTIISNSSGQDLTITADGVLQLGSVANTANFKTYNVNNFGYALPICFTRERADNFTYNLSGQAWEMVYNTSVAVPPQFFSENTNPYTSSYWKIDFALNCYLNSSLGDKGLAMYIEFEDQTSTPYLPNAYNLNTPYAVYQPISTFTNSPQQPFQNFNWSDIIDFQGLVNTGSGNVPLNMKLWVAGDNSFTCSFNMVMTLTRTNLV